jgi:transcription antitermination factor NusA-like protein
MNHQIYQKSKNNTRESRRHLSLMPMLMTQSTFMGRNQQNVRGFRSESGCNGVVQLLNYYRNRPMSVAPFSALRSSGQPLYIKTHLFVPNYLVGTLIGKKGSFINKMQEISGARIRMERDPLLDSKPNNVKKETQSETEEGGGAVESKIKGEKLKKQVQAVMAEKQEENGSTNNASATYSGVKEPTALQCASPPPDISVPAPLPLNPVTSNSEDVAELLRVLFGNKVEEELKRNGGREKRERCVYISGFEPQVYKAQYLIFEKISDATEFPLDEVTLAAQMLMPNKLIGRVIGKDGRNMKMLQQITQSFISVPKESKDAAVKEPTLETPIEIIGNIAAMEAVQKSFCDLIREDDRMARVQFRTQMLNGGPSMIVNNKSAAGCIGQRGRTKEKQHQQQKQHQSCASGGKNGARSGANKR